MVYALRYLHKVKFIFLFFILFSLKYIAQTYAFKNYSVEDGLSQSQVLCVFQDSKNRIWCGTNSGGANMFNGKTFYKFNKQNGLNGNYVSSILEKNNTIYLSTNNGIAIFNGKTFKNIEIIEKGKFLLCYDLKFLKDTLLIATENGLYGYFKSKSFKIKLDTTLDKSSIYKISVLNNKLAFSTINNGFCLIQNKKANWYKNFLNVTPNVILCSEFIDDSLILVGTNEGLYKLNYKTNKISETFKGHINVGFYHINKLNNYEFLLSTFGQGALVYNYKSNLIQKVFNQNSGFTKNSIFFSLHDKENNLWFGSDGKGLYKYKNDRFLYYTKLNGIKEEYINNTLIDSKNQLWIASRNSGVTNINQKNEIEYYNKISKESHYIIDDEVLSIYQSKNKSIFFGTASGITCKTIIGDSYSISNYYTLCFFEDNNNILWAGTSNGVGIVENKSIVIKNIFSEINDLLNSQIFVISITQNNLGEMYFATNFGLVKYYQNKTKLYKNLKEQINSVEVDFKDNLWVGSETGLYIKQNEIISPVLNQNNESFGYVNFVKKHKHLIYVGTNNGFYKINLDDYYNNKNTIKQFKKEDGLLSEETNVNSCFITDSGVVYIGGINGLQIYNPKFDVPNTVPATILINSVSLFNGSEDIFKYSEMDSLNNLPKNLILPHNKNNITFNFIGISLTAPEKVQYKYKVIGLDDAWSQPIKDNKITYPSIPPGSYTFALQATNSDGVWNKEPVFYEFVISPPWYNTKTFYASVIITLTLLIIAYNKHKTKKLVQDRIRLEQIVNIRTKELRDEKEKVELFNNEIVAQKKLIEEKQKNIIDSINYAKRIQTALMPTKKYIDKYLK
ncbi:MAG: two-component regulator propeller domain-containing protein [Bacteroidia bacterium]